MAKIMNDTNENRTVELKKGDAFMQGVFVEYGITVDDDAKEIRHGGMGSTSRREMFADDKMESER